MEAHIVISMIVGAIGGAIRFFAEGRWQHDAYKLRAV